MFIFNFKYFGSFLSYIPLWGGRGFINVCETPRVILPISRENKSVRKASCSWSWDAQFQCFRAMSCSTQGCSAPSEDFLLPRQTGSIWVKRVADARRPTGFPLQLLCFVYSIAQHFNWFSLVTTLIKYCHSLCSTMTRVSKAETKHCPEFPPST